MTRAGAFKALAPALVAAGALLLGQHGWLAVKARIAERWIGLAWNHHLEDGSMHRPWGWADTHPIALLSFPEIGVRRVVLAGASGSSLAFGPGHVDGSAAPNGDGNCVVAGHRDSWFAFLEQLEPGLRFYLRTRDRSRRYVVTRTAVHSMWDSRPLDATTGTRLTLITCFPFDGLRRSELRYVVSAQPG